MRIKGHFGIALLLFAAGTADRPTSPAQDVGETYTYCTLTDTPHKRAYVGEVFQRDKFKDMKYRSAFDANIQANYGNVSGAAYCYWKNNRSNARQDRDRYKAEWRQQGFDVIDTGWAYE